MSLREPLSRFISVSERNPRKRERTLGMDKQNRKRIWEALNFNDEVPDLKKQKDAKEEKACCSIVVPDLSLCYPQVLWYPTGTNFFKWYDLREVLGSGGFATTHLCIEKATGLKYACKVIKKERLISVKHRRDVQLEVSMMEHLSTHQNIIQFLGAYEDHHKVYLVMELCDGGELYERIVKMHFYPESDAAIVFKDIIQAVKVCHENGIMHRDLKPENLLYTSKEKTARLKVIDFGLSTFFTPGQRFCEIVGTHCYMAPEVLKGDYGQEVDIWSAGVILYILLSGETPFFGQTGEDIQLAIRNGEIDVEGRYLREISAEAKDLVRGMLNLDPKKRLTVQQILQHPWLVKMEARNLDSNQQ